MARKIVQLTDRFWHVVDIDDNKTDPEPFKVLLSPMTLAESRRLERVNMGSITRRKKGNFMADAQKYVDEAIRGHVHEVVGYEFAMNDGRVLRPMDGPSLLETLAAAPVQEATTIIDDVYDAIRGESELSEAARVKS